MKKPLILALTGRPDVGKDTIGDLLQQQGFARMAFADALRSEVVENWHIDPHMLTDRHTKDAPHNSMAADMCDAAGFIQWVADQYLSVTTPRSPRWALQMWASYQRRYCPSYYADAVAAKVRTLLTAGCQRVVVTDLREVVEEAALRRLGAVVVRVHRPDARPLPVETASHPSERHGAIKAQADIVNDGTLLALAEVVQQLVQQLEAEAAA